MPYNPTTWVNGVTAVNSTNMNKIEQGIVDAEKLALSLTLPVANNRRLIQELAVVTGLGSDVRDADSIFYDYPSSPKQYTAGIIDLTKAYAATVTTGTNTITIAAMVVGVISDFKVGQQITLQNGSTKEDLLIQAVGGSSLTFTTNIVGTYASGANAYRSNLKLDGDHWDFGGFTAQITYDRTTPVQVINAIHATRGEARPQVLSNGWIVIVTEVFESSEHRLHFRVSKDNGATFIPLTIWTGVVGNGGFSMVSYGTKIHCTRANGNTTVVLLNFDATTVGATVTTSVVLTTVTVANGSSITVNPTNGHLTAFWSEKTGALPSSYNLRSVKSTNGGVTWTKQDGTAGIDALSTNNTSGLDYSSPSAVYASNGYPMVVFAREFASNPAILLYRWTGSGWSTTINIYEANAAYSQQDPSVDIDANGVVEVAWAGLDATDSAATNIRYSKSTDGGASWTAMLKLTTGNTATQNKPSIARDILGNTYVVFIGNVSGVFQVRQIKYSGSWGAIANITVNAGDKSVPSVCSNYNNFENPITIWKTTTDVKFYGKFTVGTETAVSAVDVRLKGDTPINIDTISAWAYSNNLAGSTLDGFLSVNASLANEVYTDITDTEIEIDASNNYYASIGTAPTPNKEFTLKYRLTKPLATDDMRLYIVQGGVA